MTAPKDGLGLLNWSHRLGWGGPPGWRHGCDGRHEVDWAKQGWEGGPGLGRACLVEIPAEPRHRRRCRRGRARGVHERSWLDVFHRYLEQKGLCVLRRPRGLVTSEDVTDVPMAFLPALHTSTKLRLPQLNMSLSNNLCARKDWGRSVRGNVWGGTARLGNGR